jgi:hypothetical protein
VGLLIPHISGRELFRNHGVLNCARSRRIMMRYVILLPAFALAVLAGPSAVSASPLVQIHSNTVAQHSALQVHHKPGHVKKHPDRGRHLGWTRGKHKGWFKR